MAVRPRFRPTPWPPGEIQTPRVTIWEIAVTEDGYLEIGAQTGTKELPRDFYLREVADLAANGTDRIVEFTREWGLMMSAPNLQDLPEPLREHFAEPRSQVLERLKAQSSETGYRLGPGQLYEPQELVARAQIIRALTLHTRVLLDDVPEPQLVEAWSQPLLPTPEDPDGAWDLYAACLTGGLRPFHPRIDLDPAESDAPGEYVVDSSYQVCCLQLFNHLQTGLPYRVCANENCGRLFFTQRGRDQHGQNRTVGGVKFCCQRCGKAKWQRDQRRRERATNKNED